MHALLFLAIKHTKFEEPSLTHSKDMMRGEKFKGDSLSHV